MVAVAPEVWPTTCSVSPNLSCAEIINFVSSLVSVITTAVAPVVWPTIVSPLVKAPTGVSSKSILSPASSNVLAVSLRLEFKTKLAVWPVSDCSKIPSVAWTL